MSAAVGHVVILGLMATGKTTVGDLLAARVGRPMRDSDRDIELRTGHTGREITAAQGVDALHHLEEEVLLDALAADEPTVICAAAWVVEAERCRAAIAERATAVWLDLPVSAILDRIDAQRHRRPVTAAELQELATRRAPLFRAVADLVVDAGQPAEAIVEEVELGLAH